MHLSVLALKALTKIRITSHASIKNSLVVAGMMRGALMTPEARKTGAPVIKNVPRPAPAIR